MLKLKNRNLADIYNTLYEIPAGNSRINRGKFRLLGLVYEKVKELDEDKDRLLQKYAIKDKDGNPLPGEGNLKYRLPDDIGELNEEISILSEEEAAIDYSQYMERINEYIEYLESYEGRLEGASGEALFLLLEAFDNGSE